MTDLEKYLNDRLQQFKGACDTWLNQQKQGLQSYLNQKMEGYIAHAKQQIEIGKNHYVEQFKKSMVDLEEKRRQNQNPLMNKMYDRMEEMYKKSLESGLKSTEDIWRSQIEQCRANIK